MQIGLISQENLMMHCGHIVRCLKLWLECPHTNPSSKACHLPIDPEHKVLWALNNLNLYWNDTSNTRLSQLHQMEEFGLGAYENVMIYKEKIKRWHDKKSFYVNSE